MSRILFSSILLIAFNIQAQKLPKDALDSNTVFIFHPQASIENSEETLERFKDNIIKNGFNLVGKYIHTNSQVSLKEIEFDIQNKDVKYIFLLTYHHFKGPNYDLFYFENDSNKNPEILNPKKEILNLKPGFINSSSDYRGTILKKLEKEVAKLKSNHEGIDSKTYDTELLNNLSFTQEESSYLLELNNINTIIDGISFKKEDQRIPDDLETSRLAVVGTTKEEYHATKILNLYIKSAIKKYPFEYVYFKNYENYKAAGGDENFEYKLQMTKGSASFISSSKPKLTGTETYSRNMGNDNVNPSFSSGGSNYEKDLFTIVLRKNDTNKRFIVSERDFVGRAIKNFISQLK
ncbi:hypothetical protein [Maribacter litoralis]|uniref:hypothetical protein n=1 Tax=Maribacter litoralis TaxID=2059726 RepID=UPI000E3142F5|nr:hypothetical protein [Maribacter litoralis]